MADCSQFIVSGRVQGVGFRMAVRDRARELNLAGWVCNRRDGRVELVASGDAEALNALRDWLDHGPSPASVSRVEQTPIETTDLPISFDIR